MRRTRVYRPLVAIAIATLGPSTAAPQSPPDPLVRANATVKISERVYVIPDANVGAVPNVGLVVGEQATLVVDTGLGPRNGETILREAAKVQKGAGLYVVSTHFHPEHALGEPAFPSTATVIRARAQQQDIDEFGLSVAQIFSSRSPVMADLLRGVRFRRADLFFDRDHVLDLGGVRVRLMSLGPTHTRGDTVAFVEGDRVLFAGDIVMNRTFLAFASPYSSVKAWIAALDALAALRPVRIVPSHGEMGDASLIELDRRYLTALQSRVGELKRQGTSAEECADVLTKEMPATFPGWTNAARVGPAAKAAYGEQPSR